MFKKGLLYLALAASCFGASAHAADMNKVLHVNYESQEVGFDPAKTNDLYSSGINENIFDTLVTYDYLARPVQLVPNVIEAMPELSADGKTYTFHLKKGIYFADDPAFKGVKRELTAEDFVYSIKRLVDPVVHSPNGYLVSDKIVGLEELSHAPRGKFDYNTPIPGLKALDRYTLQITIKEPNSSFLYFLGMIHLAAVAREVMEAYADNTMAHPVGTGPYVLKEWKPANKIVLEANPNFRHVEFNSVGSGKGLDAEIAKDLKGKTLPIAGRVEVSVIDEEQPRWLSFVNQEQDIAFIPLNGARKILDVDPRNPAKVSLKPEFASKGIRIQPELLPEITYFFFNMKDPVIGGYTKERIALRRALAMSFDRDQAIRDIRQGRAVPMENIIPRNFVGNNPNLRASTPYNPALANALLDRFGYKIGADGYRTQPNGAPLEVELAVTPTAADRQWSEAWQAAFDSVKVHLRIKVAKWNENYKAAKEGSLQMHGNAWTADYPGADNFLQLLYGPNSGQTNDAFFKNAEYDRLFLQSLKMPDSPERNAIYDRMNKIVASYTPWAFSDIRIRTYVSNAYVRGYKQHPILITSWRYVDVQK